MTAPSAWPCVGWPMLASKQRLIQLNERLLSGGSHLASTREKLVQDMKVIQRNAESEKIKINDDIIWGPILLHLIFKFLFYPMTISRFFSPHPDSWHLMINKRKTPAPECLVLVVYNKQTLNLYTYRADGVKSYEEKLGVLSIRSPVAGFLCCWSNKPNQTFNKQGNAKWLPGDPQEGRGQNPRARVARWPIYRPGRHGLSLQERRGHQRPAFSGVKSGSGTPG